jgi:hypothetical protein
MHNNTTKHQTTPELDLNSPTIFMSCAKLPAIVRHLKLSQKSDQFNKSLHSRKKGI